MNEDNSSMSIVSRSRKLHSTNSCAVRPEEHSKSIAAHARRTSATSLYPGQTYRDLFEWLESQQEREGLWTGEDCLAVICDFSLKGSGRLKHLGVTSLMMISDSLSRPGPVKEAGRVLLYEVVPQRTRLQP